MNFIAVIIINELDIYQDLAKKRIFMRKQSQLAGATLLLYLRSKSNKN